LKVRAICDIYDRMKIERERKTIVQSGASEMRPKGDMMSRSDKRFRSAEESTWSRGVGK